MMSNTMKNNPLTGVAYLVKGLKALRLQSLRPFIIAPLAINILIYTIVMTYAFKQFSGWIDAILSLLPEWLAFISWILWPSFILILLFLVGYSFTLVANFIASPFNGILAEKTEAKLLQKTVSSPSSTQDWLLLIPRSIGREISKWMYILPLLLGLLVITIIPVINIIAPPLWFIFAAWSMAIQYCDFCADNNQQNFSSMKEGLRQYRYAYLGFGAAVAVLTMVPLLNLLIMPAAVIGATLMWSENNVENSE